MDVRQYRCIVFLLATCVFAQARPTSSVGGRQSNQASSSILTPSSHSAVARALFEKGMSDFVRQKPELALESWRAAATNDIHCALVPAFISFTTNDPTEESRARISAKNLTTCITPGEKLLIKWVVNIREGNYVVGIAAMNDLLAMYPTDKRLIYIAGHWLLDQKSYDFSKSLLQRALALDPQFPAALNDLGKVYAAAGDFQNAFAIMEHCLKLLPRDPTPQHSYAEILRKGGNFQGALEHDRAALKLDPGFQPAQLGIADTYALMGEEETARKEYALAIRGATDESKRINYSVQSALTYVREGKHRKATAALEEVAEHARDAHLGPLQARAYRFIASYQSSNEEALRYAGRAEAALKESGSSSGADLAEEQAKILELRAIRSAAAGRADISHDALGKLARLASDSRGTNIQRAYQAAVGAVLLLEHKEAEAIPHLEEDDRNPYSMQQLVLAYNKTGAADKAHTLELKITAINEPTLEQALVVPELRTRLAAATKRRTWLSKMVQR